MGIYLDSIEPYARYKDLINSRWFIDKTLLIDEISKQIGSEHNYICITRPRRFGKTYAANMLAAYYGKLLEVSDQDIFQNLNISRCESFERHHNKYHLIYIDFSKYDDLCSTYEEYIQNIKDVLQNDLRSSFSEVTYRKGSDYVEDLKRIFDSTQERFIFILDEWDAVFNMDFISYDDKKKYLLFLKNMLKDQAYVALAYMTGILPIAKYSSGSELNMFLEYTMAGEAKYGEYFGFLESEVNKLYSKYLEQESDKRITRCDLEQWYDGYRTASGEKIYNPRSITAALTNNNLGNYWTSSGPYDEIFFYINNNVDGVKDDIALMVAGERVKCAEKEYAATSMQLKTRDEILSAMVVYGFLSYEDGYVRIPNKELMKQFEDMLVKEESLGYVYRLAKASDEMLNATLKSDVDKMAEILEYAHNTESPMLAYNTEAELSSIVNLIYLSARDEYDIQREDKAGIGYVDYIFYPKKKDLPGIIIELKVDKSPEEALQQIKRKKYVTRFKGKLGEKPIVKKVLIVGIAYDRTEKKHGCVIETIEQ